MDAQVNRPAKGIVARYAGYANESPLQRFLTGCYEEFKSDNSGAVADYIPELQRANPAHFGVALVTIDGHVYEVGDSAAPFTIQSVSKAFVFALALDLVGEDAALIRPPGRIVTGTSDHPGLVQQPERPSVEREIAGQHRGSGPIRERSVTVARRSPKPSVMVRIHALPPSSIRISRCHRQWNDVATTRLRSQSPRHAIMWAWHPQPDSRGQHRRSQT